MDLCKLHSHLLVKEHCVAPMFFALAKLWTRVFR